jgi:hypothetical protein
MSTAAAVWAGTAGQATPFSFSDATKGLRAPRG